MPTLRFHDGEIQTDEDGFLLNGNQWTPEVADAIAKGIGIQELTDKHWKVIAQCREDAARHGRTLDGNPEQMITRISGLPRPHGAKTVNDKTEETES